MSLLQKRDGVPTDTETHSGEGGESEMMLLQCKEQQELQKLKETEDSSLKSSAEVWL